MTTRTPRCPSWFAGTAAAALLAACTSACGTSDPAASPTSTAPSARSTPSAQPSLGYRRAPSFLPSSGAVDQVVTASSAHRQLAVQGVGVRVVVPSGRALVTVTGPRVPPFTAPPPPQVTATFTVSVDHVVGRLRLRPRDFTITDQLGRTFAPSVPVGQVAPPSWLSTGGTRHFELTAAMPTGEGRIYWAPTGGRPLVGWDFVVEND